ncbi:MAG: hypothetical protein WDO73_34430 [Ignavibacteriota bacterium]
MENAPAPDGNSPDKADSQQALPSDVAGRTRIANVPSGAIQRATPEVSNTASTDGDLSVSRHAAVDAVAECSSQTFRPGAIQRATPDVSNTASTG